LSDAYQRLRDVAGPVSRETFERLVAFEQLFRRWNERINLASAATLDQLWERHILDSAQLARLAPRSLQWIDLGSGGGFPGLVLAFLLAERSGANVALIESNRKKASFLQSIVGEFSLPSRILAQRIEATPTLVPEAEIVTARALAPLPALLDLASPWLTSGARALFHKGRDYRIELEESAHRWRFDLLEHRIMTEAQGVILEIGALRRA
jgi:16S rRNA (guanine527-N7)-methyltransferase